LEAQLKSEQANRALIEGKLKWTEDEIKRIKHNTVNLQAKVEEEEEFITNNLLKRLEVVKKEKEHLAKQVEIEEEFMTNNLQKKLSKLRKEKVELERHLEAEQEYFVNKLQKQLLEITRQKNALERKLNEGRSGLISQFEQTVGDCKESLHSQSCPRERNSIAQLEAQIADMRGNQLQVEHEAHEYRERCEQHAKALEQLSCENVVLDCQATRLKEKFQQLQNEREAEFAQFELSEERQFNLSIRRSSSEVVEGSRSRSRSATPLDVTPRGSTPHGHHRAAGDHHLMREATPNSGPGSGRKHSLGHVKVTSDPTSRQRSSCASSNFTSPGNSSSPTPPPSASPKRWCHGMLPVGSMLKRHTEEVLGMSPMIVGLTPSPQEQSPVSSERSSPLPTLPQLSI
jgi:coiled-coil domain-containing protein 6